MEVVPPASGDDLFSQMRERAEFSARFFIIVNSKKRYLTPFPPTLKEIPPWVGRHQWSRLWRPLAAARLLALTTTRQRKAEKSEASESERARLGHVVGWFAPFTSVDRKV